MLLDEALQSAPTDATEVSEACAVPELPFCNRAEHAVAVGRGCAPEAVRRRTGAGRWRAAIAPSSTAPPPTPELPPPQPGT
jgi:hypothetical protein